MLYIMYYIPIFFTSDTLYYIILYTIKQTTRRVLRNFALCYTTYTAKAHVWCLRRVYGTSGPYNTYAPYDHKIKRMQSHILHTAEVTAFHSGSVSHHCRSRPVLLALLPA